MVLVAMRILALIGDLPRCLGLWSASGGSVVTVHLSDDESDNGNGICVCVCVCMFDVVDGLLYKYRGPLDASGGQVRSRAWHRGL